MKYLAVCSLIFITNVFADMVSTSCLSESKLSRYDLKFDTDENVGNIRYRFMKQDIFYDVIITEQSYSKIKGTAHFGSSNSGETKGHSFEFVYDHSNNLFSEFNVQAKCLDRKIIQ